MQNPREMEVRRTEARRPGFPRKDAADPLVEQPSERLQVLTLAVTFGIAAAVFAAIAGLPCVALTPDSTTYINTAENVRRGAGLVTTITPIDSKALSVPFASWPPLFPIMIAALLPVTDDPLAATKLVQMLVSGLMAIPVGFLAYRVAGRRLVLPVLALYAVFRPFVLVESFAWSEPLFMLCTYGSLALLAETMCREQPNGKGRYGYYAIAGCFAGLAMLTRYIGLTVIATGVIVLATTGAERDASGSRTLTKLLWFGLPAGLPNVAWLIRNRVVTGYVFGEDRAGSTFDPQSVILTTLRTFWTDVAMPHVASEGPARVILSAASLACFALLVGMWFAHFGPEAFGGLRGRGVAATLLAVFTTLYVIAIVGLSIGIEYDPISSRFLAPIYPGLLVLGVLPLRLIRHRKLVAVVIAGAIFLAIQAAATIRYVGGPREDRSQTEPYWRSVTFGDRRWKDDVAVRGAMEAAPAGTLILSNIADAIAIWSDRPVKSLPGRDGPAVDELVTRHPGAIILVHPGYRRLLTGVEELDRMVAEGKCARLGERGEGQLYRVLR